MAGTGVSHAGHLRTGDALRAYVAAVHAYDVDLGTAGVHRGLPSTFATLVLPLGDPLEVGWAGRPLSRGSRWSTVAGLHTEPAQIHHHGHQRGIQLSLTPAGVRALLGAPASALAGELLEVDAFGGPGTGLSDLPERLAETSDLRAGLDVVLAVLLARLAAGETVRRRAEVGRALACLTRGDRVAEVAAEVGLSRRRLATLVREECGIGPKEYQRISRFQRSRAALAHDAASGRSDLAGVAGRVGYVDQAHLTREWTVLAGCPPARWLREEFPFLQDTGSVDRGG